MTKTQDGQIVAKKTVKSKKFRGSTFRTEIQKINDTYDILTINEKDDILSKINLRPKFYSF